MTEIGNELTTAQVAHRAGDVILDKKGQDVVVLEISQMPSNLADYLIIATGTNQRQVRAIAQALEIEMKAAGVKRISSTGKDFGWWVLIDFGDVLVHVMQEDARRYYDLEALWADAPVVRRAEGSPQTAQPPDPTPADPLTDPDRDASPA